MASQTAVQSGFVTRFAPSPTGLLHKGHAYSALKAFRAAQAANGRFLLRIEDIDTTRCWPEFTDAIFEDLAWLGLTWEKPVRIQSRHFDDYRNALLRLQELDVVYPCFCTRKDIHLEIARSPSAPHGPDGPLYPGTCRKRSKDERQSRIQSGDSHAWRLNLAAALSVTGHNLTWTDTERGEVAAKPEELGDVVLARKDTPTSYHLSVVRDDTLQGITHVVRGEDLFHATHIHVVLQKLLGFPTPVYSHHGLLTNDSGKRFAKRDKALTLRAIRESGTSSDALINSLRLG